MWDTLQTINGQYYAATAGSIIKIFLFALVKVSLPLNQASTFK